MEPVIDLSSLKPGQRYHIRYKNNRSDLLPKFSATGIFLELKDDCISGEDVKQLWIQAEDYHGRSWIDVEDIVSIEPLPTPVSSADVNLVSLLRDVEKHETRCNELDAEIQRLESVREEHSVACIEAITPIGEMVWNHEHARHFGGSGNPKKLAVVIGGTVHLVTVYKGENHYDAEVSRIPLTVVAP